MNDIVASSNSTLVMLFDEIIRKYRTDKMSAVLVCSTE